MLPIRRALLQLGRPFLLLWSGQTIAALGGALLSFALGVWVYEKTRSAEDFAFVFLASSLPSILFSPLAGSIADHFDRRWVIVWTDIIGAALAAALAVLVHVDQLEVAHLYAVTALSSICGAIRLPAYQAAVSATLPHEVLTRASGLIGVSQGLLGLAVPMSAGFLMSAIGLGGIVMIQVPTALAGGLAVFAAFSHAKSIPRPTSSQQRPWRSFLTGLAPAIACMRKEPLLLTLLAYEIVHDGLIVIASTLLTPLVLATHSSTELGLIGSCGAAGGIAGSLLLTVANTESRLMMWMLVTNLCVALCVAIAGSVVSVPLWCACAFLALLAGSAGGSCAQALWMRKTPNAIQGSVFSLLAISELIVASVVVFFGGVLGEHVFEPGLAADGVWADTMGRWVGVGPGRGLGFLFVLAGLVSVILTLWMLVNTRVRGLDRTLPDMAEVVDARL